MMTIPDVNLYCLYLSLPTEFEAGEPKGFRDKSIGKIMDDNVFFEVITLHEWLLGQFSNYLEWDDQNPITSEVIAKALETFQNLGHKLTECKYLENESENNEQT